jgi:hypothetical protein
MKITAIIGILVPVVFILGLIVLFNVNPKTYEELNNLSLAAYNIAQMDFHLWAAVVIYFLVGVLNVIFCVVLFFKTPNRSILLVGKILLLLAGLAWLSLGILSYDPTADISFHLLMIRVITVILTSSIGMIFIGSEIDYLSKSIFFKWYTLSSGFSILVLSFLSAFVYNDTTWIRTNISFVIYFAWFGVFGILTLVRTKASTVPTL